MTHQSVSYKGYSTDFIPLPSKTGYDEPLFGPGDPVLARYPGTRVFLPGLCHLIEPVSVKICFVGDEDRKIRDVSPRFVIPWKARSPRDSIEPGPPLLSFCFTIRSIRPDYGIQARSTITWPGQRWMPPRCTREFRVETNSGPYQWHNGLVQPIPSAEQHYWVQYSTTSMFWVEDRQAFLQVPYDCTKIDVREAQRGGVPSKWEEISFHQTSWLWLLGYKFERNTLSTYGSSAWMPELLPERYGGHLNDGEPVRLAGDLSIIIGLAAFSGPPDKMVETIQNSFRAAGPRWTPHGHGGEGSE
jgi:hypothetical protein